MRGYFNVFATLVATAAIPYGVTGHAVQALFMGAPPLRRHTTASEIGVTGKTPYLIDAPWFPGTNGGDPPRRSGGRHRAGNRRRHRLVDGCCRPLMVVVTVIVIGTNVDSVVGATLENSGRIGNSGTNLAATFVGGVSGMVLYLLG